MLKAIKDKQLKQLNHLKHERKGITTIGDNNNNDYRRRRLRGEDNINNTNEYDRLLGELLQTTIDAETKQSIEARHKLLNDKLSKKQNNHKTILPQYIKND